MLGDSLTSGFELGGGQGYVQVLEKELLAKGYNVDLRSAAIAGQSTRQGRDWVFVEPVLSADIVLLQLGGNDANYRVLPERIKENLDYMITNFQQRGQLVVFMANKFTPKYGQNYRAEIEDLFDALEQIHATLGCVLFWALSGLRASWRCAVIRYVLAVFGVRLVSGTGHGEV